MIIGIDIGSTITKVVSVENKSVVHKIKTKALDVVTSATGAFGKIVVENGIKISDIERIMITGAGATKLQSDLFGIPTKKVNEITAIGIGGMFLSKSDNIVITNIGTGTAIVLAEKDKISHLGGSGVGGGTILGLSKMLLRTSNFNDIMKLAEAGDPKKIDLLIGDIMDSDISFLSKDSTVSNFGKTPDNPQSEDIAIGIVSMVYQVIGMLSVFAARSRNIDRIIVTGNGSDNPIGKKILQAISRLHSVNFEYPDFADYTTAIGAGLASV